eukprot:8730928-Pyramimonas_sp.AAC.1
MLIKLLWCLSDKQAQRTLCDSMGLAPGGSHAKVSNTTSVQYRRCQVPLGCGSICEIAPAQDTIIRQRGNVWDSVSGANLPQDFLR